MATFGPPMHSWVYWDQLAKVAFPWEVAITNQPVVGAEDVSTPIHAALRGGVSVGATSGNRSGRFGAVSWISVFPFLSDAPVAVELRGGAIHSRDEAIALAGTYLAHEIGHQILHLGHPWGNPACVMRPAALFDFRGWRARLDPAGCLIGGSPAMTPGAVKFGFPLEAALGGRG